jgi:hypothetical protein
MNLHAVSKLVAEHSGSEVEIQRKLDRAAQERALVRGMFNWVTWGLIIMGIGVVLIMVNKSLHIDGLFRLLGMITTLSGMGIVIGGAMNTVRKGLAAPDTRPQREIASTKDPNALPTNPIPPALPSVTERTTQLLDVPSETANR